MRIFETSLDLTAEQCGSRGRLRLSGVLQLAQNAASEHMNALGAGREAMAHKGLMWVIVKQQMSVSHLPCAGETITLRTWLAQGRHGLYSRHYVMLSEDNTMLVRGNAIWSMVDAVTRHMVVSGVKYESVTLGSELPKQERITIMDKTKQFTFVVPNEYLDENHHMNNSHYPDIAEKGLGLEIDTPRRVRIEYLREALLGQVLTVDWCCINGEYYLCGSMGETVCFRMAWQNS